MYEGIEAYTVHSTYLISCDLVHRSILQALCSIGRVAVQMCELVQLSISVYHADLTGAILE